MKTKPAAEETPRATPKKAAGRPPKNVKTPPSKTTPARAAKKVTTAYTEFDVEDDLFDDEDGGEDIFTENFKKGAKKNEDDYIEDEEEERQQVQIKSPLPHRSVNGKHNVTIEKKETPSKKEASSKRETPSRKAKPKKEEDDDGFMDVDEDDVLPIKGRGRPKAGTKRKSPEIEEDDEEDEPLKRGRKSKAPAATKSPAKKKAKKEDGEPESEQMRAIFDSIPTVRPPTPPPPSGEGQKFNFRANHANSGPAPAAGAVEIPTGQPNCLAGLTFVFTGLLEYLQREEAQNLVKRYGGKITGAPSKKTSYVVLGSDAGPKKLQTIKDNNIRTINEEGLFELIKRLPANGGDSKAAAQFEEKQKAEAQKIKQMAAEMEKEDRRLGGAGGAGLSKPVQDSCKSKSSTATTMDSRLWTVKYAPTQLSQICGNKTAVDKLQRWLRNFPKNQRTGFKLAGADGSGVYRAVLIHGPPGIGKTTAAHLVSKLEGYDVVESNASDTRSKKLVEQGLKGVLSTTSLLGYFAGDGQKVEASKRKLVLIMDEVDGMSAGDRGGVGALAAVCKKTQIPMILICNDRRQPKMKPFDFVTYDLPFRRPTTDNIRSRVMTIAYREGLRLPPNVIDALIEGSHADIRQVVNMISTAKLDQTAMDFDTGKQMSKNWEKHVILKPWDIVSKILGGGMFSESSKSTLNDKIELYFNDHEFSFLMLQENYLGTQPIRANKYSGKERNYRLLELVDNAADSISDGDLVDRMIHGSQQHWSLMPAHAVFSFVRPASFMSGSMAGHKTNFTSWLGKNSTQQRLTRMVKEIQGHMRLRCSGDRHEVRQQYVPMLWSRMVKRLQAEGKEAVPEIIDLMDSYFLTREDFDAVMELGVGPMDQDNVKIDTQAKATFTRL